ncbi:GntR family transcriptional regulator [Sneathiella chinensis]|uniref:GntR family transcriptional regulator n=1 Tax=Sneathiella chinensis TaxID=349750 RepID=A0ABQ5U1R8_9PROT|nr:GntR family transcriptional regulator [Sneathiella chinensis]
MRSGDGIPLYLKLASVFREKITRGEWPAGEQIATLPDLKQQYGVARATVQQAIRILSEEGLLSSSRGRGTFVIPQAERQNADQPPPYDQLELDPRFNIRILSRTLCHECRDVVRPLAPDMGPFIHIRKQHLFFEMPYSLVDLYVPKDVFDKIPSDADQTRLYAQLVRDYSDFKNLDGKQSITIVQADHESAVALGVTLASPLARIDSTLVTDQDIAVMSHRALIRSDLFQARRTVRDFFSADPKNWRPTAKTPNPEN